MKFGRNIQRTLETLHQANAATLTPFSKEDKILIKNLYECKGYNARQLIFRIKVGRRTALTGCW